MSEGRATGALMALSVGLVLLGLAAMAGGQFLWAFLIMSAALAVTLAL